MTNLSGSLPIETKHIVKLSSSNFDTSSTHAFTYYWVQAISDQYKPLIRLVKTNDVIVPAFHQAKKDDTFKGTYNQTTGNILVQWTVNDTELKKDTKPFIDGGKFVLERSTDADFKNNKKSYDITFSKDSTKYSVVDNIAALSNKEKFYYRILRTIPNYSWIAGNQNWADTTYRKMEVPISGQVAHAGIKKESVKLTIEGDKAKITYELTGGHWETGARLVIKKTHETGSTPLQDMYVSDEKKIREGVYIDGPLATCNAFSYALFIEPPANSIFTAQDPVPADKMALIEEIGTINSFSASKGYYSDKTELQWNATGAFDDFVILRIEYGTTDTSEIHTKGAGTYPSYTWSDKDGVAGTYYNYQIFGVISCDNKPVKSNQLSDIGFRTPTGSIYGRVTYKNGQAVEGVEILLEAKNIDMGYSMKLNKDVSLSVKDLKTKMSNDSLTIQTWFMFEGDTKPTNQTLFGSTQYELGFDGTGNLFFRTGVGTANIFTSPYKFSADSFYHVSAVKKGAAAYLYVKGDPKPSSSKTVSAITAKEDSVFYLGRANQTNKPFVGYIDEVRLWNRALTGDEIERDYSRLLVGDEDDLIAYYRFNEEMKEAFYDLSFVKTKYNENHGVITGYYDGLRSKTIPPELGLKGITDNNGDYYVNGVPYVGNGTQYTVIPKKGDHFFNPTSALRMISSEDPSREASFEDQSSFIVQGIIWYENTNIPVADVNFKVDGILVDDGKGGLAKTNARGEFSISVPVGVHEVRAEKQGHVFKNDGRILNQETGEDLDYQSHMAEVELWDITKVRVIGRVAGGAVQEAFPVGHSLSKNNLGDDLFIKLVNKDYKLLTGKFPDKKPDDIHVEVEHLIPSNWKEGDTTAVTKVVYSQDAIYIYPDKYTGEYCADLIPFWFNIDSVYAVGHENVMGLDANVLARLDLQSSVNLMDEVYAYTDSVPDKFGAMDYYNYSDTVFYHHKANFIKRVKTEIDFNQVNPAGEAVPYMGEAEIEFSNLFGDTYMVPIYSGGKYTFQNNNVGIPTYLQGNQYVYIAQAFEAYRYNGSTNPEEWDKVPSVDGLLQIKNDLAPEGEREVSIPLDDTGTAIYVFSVGGPSSSTKTFSAHIKLSNNQLDEWLFEGKTSTMNAFVIGSMSKGSDFVTNGPKQLITVLRDPPGSNSYAYLEAGTVITSSTTKKEGVKQSGEHDVRAVMGAEYKAAAGTPFFMQVTEIKTENSAGGIVSHEQSHFDGNSTTKKTTLMTRFETSGDPIYVGRDGDVLIGNSTNIVYGVCEMYLMMETGSDAAKDGDEVIFTSVDGKYKLIKRLSYNSDVQFHTMFAHPQVHIENRLIPELVGLKNSYLQYGSEWTPTIAQTYANSNNTPVYVSKLNPDDPYYGCSNNDDNAFGTKSNGATFLMDGPSYTIYFPDKMPEKDKTDTIFALNQSIKNWYDLLAQNEKAKLNANRLHNNYSFHAGSQIEYSEEYSYETASTYEYEYFVGAAAVVELGFQFNGFGFKTTFQEGGYDQGANESSDTEEYTRKEGFVLAEEGGNDYLSVDVYYETSETMDYESTGSEGLDDMIKGPFVYRTKGGVTSCPYEGARLTKYYQPGAILDEATVQLEVPVLKIEPAVVHNIPLTRPAVYRLTMENQSHAGEDSYYVLQVLDGTNPNGAKLSIDGQAFSNTGRTFLVPFGEPVVKTLEVRAGADSVVYEDIKLILRSQCQYDPTGFQETIADTVSISAYFTPGCSDINIKVPLENFIVNTQSEFRDAVYHLPVILDGYDPNNMSLIRIELQMKQEDESQWQIMHTFYADPDEVKNERTESLFDRTKAQINYNLPMERYDSRYQLRAVTYCYDAGEEIPTSSTVITGTKDTERPKLFGSAQPANGILDSEGNIQLTFNETIKEGALSRYNFQVKGIKNGSNTTHNASVEFDGVNDYVATEAERNLVDKDLTVEMWVYRATGSGAGTLFSFGNQNKALDFGFDASDRLTVQYGGATVTSDALPIQPGTQWAHVAMVYETATGSVSLFYNSTNVANNKPIGLIDVVGHFEFGRSARGSGYYAGKIHELRVWNRQLTAGDLQVNRLKIYSGSESDLLGYYPMSECKGDVVIDKSMGANGALHANWSTRESRAASFDGNSIINIPSVEMRDDMDYTIELWFKAESGQTNTALISNEIKQTANISGITNAQRFFLGFNESGKLMFRSNEREEIIENKDKTDYRDNNWHHVALSVNRVTRRTEVFVDGNLITQFSSNDIEGMSATAISIGGIREMNNNTVTNTLKGFKGNIDEVRFWNSALTEDVIVNSNNVRLIGDEMGLIAYYPFEVYVTVDGITSLSYSLANQAINDEAKGQTGVASNAASTNQAAPIKDRGPIENIAYSFVVSDKSIIIYLEEDMDVIEKSTVTFSVKEVQDMFGNETLSPIIWSAYIDRNLLRWDENEVTLRKNEYAPLEFEVDIVNTGGMIERFSIENLPLWLTAAPMTGSVGPKAKQTIKFVINEGVNVGRYSEIIYMKNSKNVSEQLALNLIVGGDVPDWRVNPGDFEQSMSVFGKLRIDGIFSNDKEDMLAAFIDGKCVGVVNNSYQAKTNSWYAFLTVYGNKENADADIEFRIWDSSTGKTYAATTTQNIAFRNETIAGTSENPLIFDTSELVFQNMKLNQGWNWISFQVNNNRLDDVTYVLQNATWNSSDIVKDADLFDSYSATAKTWAGTLSQNGGFNNTSLYMLKSSTAQVLSVNGRLVDPKATPIAVKGGNRWTYISYLSPANMSVDEALADYPAQSGDVIKSQEGFAMYDGYSWIGNLTFLEPYKGYMLLRTASNDVSFRYPTVSGSLSTKAGMESNDFFYQNYDHANNMTLTAVIDKDFDLRSGDRVVALVDNEVRGMSEVTHSQLNELHFINIVSDEPGLVRFVVERNGQRIATANTKFDYGVNKVTGSLLEPLELDFTGRKSISLYPNPFTTVLNIDFTLEQTGEVEIIVNDMTGRLIRKWDKRTYGEGNHVVEWHSQAQIAGIYLVTVIVDGEISSHKVIKTN
ncbi:T9SS type A sorting domain-containing protein [Parabacteroides sp. OttesenSCG-928-K15]|nr:T9SS type A sorting domain-containing protein [Parabacteroides sp. OttesenSCG-928-K15]